MVGWLWSLAASEQRSGCQGPPAELDFSDDVAFWNLAPMSAIRTVVAMVAHDEVVGFADHFRAVVFVAPEIQWYIIIGKKHFIHINSSVFDPDRVAFLCDDPLDEGLVRVPRVIQHDDVARLRQTEKTIQRFVYDESVLVRQSRFHALTLDPRDLKAEGDN